MPDVLSLEIDQQVALLTLNRPDKLNALSDELLAGIEDAAIFRSTDAGLLNSTPRFALSSLPERAGRSVPAPILPASNVTCRRARPRRSRISCGQGIA